MVTRVAVVTITCRVCGRVLAQTIPRRYTAEEWEATEPVEREIDVVDKPVGTGFAQARCTVHPPGQPDIGGFRYSPEACPFLWNVRVLELG